MEVGCDAVATVWLDLIWSVCLLCDSQVIPQSPERKAAPFNFRAPMDNLVIRTFQFPTV